MTVLRGTLMMLVIVMALAPRAAQAQALIADLSDHLIAITAGFSGTKVLLFGAIEGDGDIVVVLRGPATTTTVRRKARVAGIWVNRREITYGNVPALYYISASRPISPGVRTHSPAGPLTPSLISARCSTIGFNSTATPTLASCLIPCWNEPAIAAT